MTVDLQVLILPAFDDLDGLPGEASAWDQVYDFDHTIDIEGFPTSLRYTEKGVGIVPTGIGKSAAATTVTALLASDHLDLSETFFLTVGVAGGPPEIPVGSVIISDAIVDWDDKVRFDEDATDSENPLPLAMNPYTEGEGWYGLNDVLVSRAESCAEDVELSTPDEMGESAQSPELLTGTNLSGDELWHGHQMAEQAEWVTDEYGVGSHLVTEMEDAGTATALSRFDRLDEYCSIRGVSNHDRPVATISSRESFFAEEFESGFAVGLENAVAVATPVLESHLD